MRGRGSERRVDRRVLPCCGCKGVVVGGGSKEAKGVDKAGCAKEDKQTESRCPCAYKVAAVGMGGQGQEVRPGKMAATSPKPVNAHTMMRKQTGNR
jgi:hypothetical protein